MNMQTVEIENSIPLTFEEAQLIAPYIIKQFSDDNGLSTTYVVEKENQQVVEDLFISFLE